MLEIACVAGLLIFNTTAYNPNQIASISLESDHIRVTKPGGQISAVQYPTDGDGKEAKEAWEYSLEAWRECLKEQKSER